MYGQQFLDNKRAKFDRNIRNKGTKILKIFEWHEILTDVCKNICCLESFHEDMSKILANAHGGLKKIAIFAKMYFLKL